MLDQKLKEYIQAFGEGFPMIPLGWGRSEEEVIEIIDRCLKEKKDAYALGYVEDGDDFQY